MLTVLVSSAVMSVWFFSFFNRKGLHEYSGKICVGDGKGHFSGWTLVFPKEMQQKRVPHACSVLCPKCGFDDLQEELVLSYEQVQCTRCGWGKWPVPGGIRACLGSLRLGRYARSASSVAIFRGLSYCHLPVMISTTLLQRRGVTVPGELKTCHSVGDSE
eukprot:g48923.t1